MQRKIYSNRPSIHDDILVYGRSEQEHLQQLTLTLQRLRENQLFAQRLKCEFAVQRIEYLGHIIDHRGIQVDPVKIQAVRDWSQPQTLHDLQSFLGLANYYRKFIPSFAPQAAPLTDLLQQNTTWTWGS